jgi:hypothetical protein
VTYVKEKRNPPLAWVDWSGSIIRKENSKAIGQKRRRGAQLIVSSWRHVGFTSVFFGVHCQISAASGRLVWLAS